MDPNETESHGVPATPAMRTIASLANSDAWPLLTKVLEAAELGERAGYFRYVTFPIEVPVVDERVAPL